MPRTITRHDDTDETPDERSERRQTEREHRDDYRREA